MTIRDIEVKELAWRELRPTDDDGVAQDAYTPIGHYIATETGWFLAGQTQWADAFDLEHAKAGAQSDFDARIRSALIEDEPRQNYNCPCIHPSQCDNSCFSTPPAEPVKVTEGSDPLAELVSRFSAALLEKLKAAEAKYGYSDDWMKNDWRDELAAKLIKHVHKGDPRDVAAYCAFAWHHGWSITPASDKEAK